ncbi:MAG TPA: class I SAM-dependent methyltransferase [Candidatus Aphodomorpha intestinavium]|uniref:Class I SAM-dependent methyltransferase n=1 Tax=Candidatus Aphodomorpha intestinavium TaxID=2840672 RepID=A0A9D1N391_9FIRM|nr:class I SAM-dependent methyltransferase [Candidatus Aphodomorpha intestinavium]
MDSPYTAFAAVYDALMHDVPYDRWAQRLDALLRAALAAPAGAAVADAACGTGALTVRLAQRGYRMTGADLSADMLRVAQEKARRSGLSIPFVQMDLRALRFHRPMDAIVCACDGVNYLTSRAALTAFFRAAHAALRPGGALLFDVSTRYKLAQVLGGNCFGEDLPACTYLWRNAYDPEQKLLEMRLNCFLPQPDGRYARFDEVHVQRAHSDRELKNALAGCGFAVERVYDGLTDAPAGARTERAQYVCRRLDG